jgi:DNA repair exonuclease SbcCD ATPase subunit
MPPLAIELSSEEYEAKKLLARIGEEIARGRAELAEIRANAPKYLQQREEEATRLVESVLAASKAALNQAEANREQLRAYHRELSNFAGELEEWQQSLAADELAYEEKKEAFEEQTARRTQELETITSDLRIQKELIAADKLSISNLRTNIKHNKAALGSERVALQVAWDELQNKHG